MSETPMKLVVDCSKPKGEREQYVPLTEEEIAQMEIDRANFEAEKLAQEQAEAEREAAKQSAKEKLASLGLTEAEVIALLGN